jgi:hypothetical protein
MADEVFHYPQGAVDAFTRQLNDDIAGAVKFLLEEKHLYQKASIDPDGIVAKVPPEYANDLETVKHAGLDYVVPWLFPAYVSLGYG